MRTALLLLLSLSGCDNSATGQSSYAAGDPWSQPGCGDGVVDEGEACDDGADNSDTTPDACRLNCQLPSCGDSVVDATEACDDGSPYGGDGCTPYCVVEEGALEVEPNDDPESTNEWSDDIIHGALPPGDRDCFDIPLSACGAVTAEVSGDCSQPTQLALYTPAGALVALGGPGPDGCALLDPAYEPGARFVSEAGTWAVCVSSPLDSPVAAYGLDLVPLTIDETAFELSAGDDPDGDGRPDVCDDDRDGDGVLNADDNCPDVPNGAAPINAAPSADGFLRSWLAAGPYGDLSSPERCLPVAEPRIDALDDADITPELGGAAGDRSWQLLLSGEDRVELLGAFGGIGAPREAYLAGWIRSATPQDATIALGPDDGARVWLDGEVVLEVSGCQGTNVDQFTAPVSLSGEWQQLHMKIYDQGGGWGTYVRLLDLDGAPITDLEFALSTDGPLVSDQTDSDGDGIGDACDEDP